MFYEITPTLQGRFRKISCKSGNIEMGLIEVDAGHWVDQCCVNCT